MNKKIALCALLVLMSVVLCACGGSQSPAAPSPSPAVSPTATPSSALSSAVLSACADASALSGQVTAALSTAYNINIPAQNAATLAQVLNQQTALTEKDGAYTFTLSSGGDYTYDKPYASISYGSSVDSYVVSEDGEPQETVENTFYDPLAYVMAGEGGGDFAYASYYIVKADGLSAEYETVSRLNQQITGYSHYEYARSGDTFYFADAQLNLDINQDNGPYTWVICVGEISKDSADVFEFTQLTTAMSLPAIFPRVQKQGTVSAASFASLYAKDLVSRLIVKNGSVSLEQPSGTLNAKIE